MKIAIDFDGTIVEYDGYKGCGVYGELKKDVAESIRKLKDAGHEIIINTCRSEDKEIIDLLRKNDIPFDFINFHPDNIKLGLSNKVYADYYIDDRAIEFKDNWSEIVDRINGK